MAINDPVPPPAILPAYRAARPIASELVLTARISVKQILARGSVLKRGALALPCEIVCERNAQIILRDGMRIYADVFRPAGEAIVPAIVAWSPYGKQKSTHGLNDFPFRAGVPQSLLSGLEKFEGPDPAYWCAQGYAVINPDGRGAFNSEGDIPFWGMLEGRDGYDVIEWIAAQPWCNGKVGMSGNSWLAVSQWFIAAQHPPHLTAIAPWEGVSDFFREGACQGGIPEPGFVDWVVGAFVGTGRVEDPVAMLNAHPLWCDYWDDKKAQPEHIDIPAYVVASWTNPLHVWGTLRAYRQLATRKKWLRVHDAHEWVDYYDAQNVAELTRFFDCYLKGVENGWEETPRVRLSVFDPGHANIVNRVEPDYPPPDIVPRRLFLDMQSSTLVPLAPTQSANLRYNINEQTGKGANAPAHFVYRFDRLTEFCGPSMLRLWVEADGADDMDLFVRLQKLDAKGRFLPLSVLPVPAGPLHMLTRWLYRRNVSAVAGLYTSGPNGRLRVSRRATDPERSTAFEPVLTFREERKLAPGEIVPVDIALRPIAWRFHSGEQLRLEIAGKPLESMGIPGVAPLKTLNRGIHILHAGGIHDAHLLLPERAHPNG